MKASCQIAIAAGLCLLGVLVRPSAAADAISPADARFFETQVRPLLAEHCFQCHGPDKQKGGLRLDSLGEILAGGESGPALVAGKPEESLLIEAVRYESYEMPPNGKLTDKQIQTLTDWVKRGAPWPGDTGAPVNRDAADPFSEEDRAWWAIQPVQKPVPPATSLDGWARNDIDRFIAAQLVKQGLTPAPEADRITLIRRLYFDLVGLPPTPEQVDAFIHDEDPQAYERLVDRLLDSPEYGERWARHWLDLVRYADSDGYRADGYRPEAWRYRDYVIKSLNEDKPYNRFVQEQIAGDELFPGDPDALIATGYLRHGIYEYNQRDARGQWDIMVGEVTDVTGDVFLGLGMQCAKCHDHKFDPLLQRDYFALRAFFEPLLPHDDLVVATPEEVAAYEKKLAGYNEKTAQLQAELKELEQPYLAAGAKSAIERFPDDIKAMIAKPDEERAPLEKQLVALAWRQVVLEYERADSRFKGDEKDRILALRRQLAAFDAEKPAPLPRPMTVRDVGPVAPPTIIPKKKTEVAPGYPTILGEPAPVIEPLVEQNSTGRRSVLAAWLTRPDNPLTTRVMANRIWQYHFGRGLAENSSDFGRLGAPPSHPELLDWLTTRFLQDGWRMKSLHRLIVNSATYRQSAAHPRLAEYQLKDPANLWYWRGNTRRLDAEQIRDAVFAVTGQLDSARGGPGVLPDKPRRSIYTRYMRNARDPFMDVFDLPQFFSSASSRDTTTSPVQSLLLFNSQTMLRHAGELARRTRSTQASGAASDLSHRIRELWKLALGREPSEAERSSAEAFLVAQAQRIGQGQETSTVPNVVTGKVPYRDGQAVMFQPEGDQSRFTVAHDERLNLADFTVEAHFQLRSVYETGSVRTIATKWSGQSQKPGWSFGVTGKGSRRKPQTLVLQIFGNNDQGELVEAALFSDQHVEVNKPYFAAVSVRLASEKGPGSARFFLKDLSNDDEPLQVVEIPHQIVGGFDNREALCFGARGVKDGRFDGLIDDVRLSRGALSVGQLLYTSEGVAPSTVGYWQFEPEPGVFQDSASGGLNVHPVKHDQQLADPEAAAFVDLCQILLNSNEFLYVD